MRLDDEKIFSFILFSLIFSLFFLYLYICLCICRFRIKVHPKYNMIPAGKGRRGISTLLSTLAAPR